MNSKRGKNFKLQGVVLASVVSSLLLLDVAMAQEKKWGGVEKYREDMIEDLTQQNIDMTKDLIDKSHSTAWQYNGKSNYLQNGTLSCNWNEYRYYFKASAYVTTQYKGMFFQRFDTEIDIDLGPKGVEDVKWSAKSRADSVPSARERLEIVLDAAKGAQQIQLTEARERQKLMLERFDRFAKHWETASQYDLKMYHSLMKDVIPQLAALGYFGEKYQPREFRARRGQGISALEVEEGLNRREFAQKQLDKLQDLAIKMIQGYPTAASSEMAGQLVNIAKEDPFAIAVWGTYFDLITEELSGTSGGLDGFYTKDGFEIPEVVVESYNKSCQQNEQAELSASSDLAACGASGKATMKDAKCFGSGGGGGLGGIIESVSEVMGPYSGEIVENIMGGDYSGAIEQGIMEGEKILEDLASQFGF